MSSLPEDAGAEAWVAQILRAAEAAPPGAFDELRGRSAAADAGGAPAALAPAWRRFFSALGPAGWADLQARAERVQRRVRDDGATYNVYADGHGSPRAWPLQLLPFIVDAAEWSLVERGVAQRARLLNAVLADIYGARRLLAEGVLPASLVLAHPQYLRPVQGCRPAGDQWLHVVAFDLARDAAGRWQVLAQRCQAPSGLGYLLENRLAVAPQFPHAFARLRVQRIASSYRALLDGLLRASPAGIRSRVALLTPGPYSETFFEQLFLARYLGISLVEGGDLTVRDGRVYLKTLRGLERVHVLLRRVDDEFVDPLELRPDSALGVPGLLQAVRSGQVVLANMPGAGVLESPGLAAFWPGAAERLLGEALHLPAATTWWCGEASVWQAEREHLAAFNLLPTFPASAATPGFEPGVMAGLPPGAVAQWQRRVDADPAAHTLQAAVQPSHTPLWRAGRLLPSAAVWRVFALADGSGGWRVLPGGLTRVAAPAEPGAEAAARDPWLSMQHGSASADTWVLTDGPVDALTLLPKPLTAADLAGWHRTVTSRSAENLFWLGRYCERAENGVRLARLALEALPTGDAATLELLGRLAVRHGLVAPEVPSPRQSPRVFERSLLHGLGRGDGSSVAFSLRALRRCAHALRERLSGEHWKLIQEVGDHFEQHLAAVVRRHAAARNGQRDGPAGDHSDAPRVGEASPATAPALPTPEDPEGVTDVLGLLARAATHLAAITGAQTDRMTRDDGWRLLSVGRHLERLDVLAHALATGLECGAHRSDEGFALLLGVFDSTITYRAQFQARRELLPLLHLLVLDTDNPRSLAWVARTMRDRFVKLARPHGEWSTQVAAQLPQPQDWALEALVDAAGEPKPELLQGLQACSAAAQALSDELGVRLFSHARGTTRLVWQ